MQHDKREMKEMKKDKQDGGQELGRNARFLGRQGEDLDARACEGAGAGVPVAEIGLAWEEQVGRTWGGTSIEHH